MPFDFRNNQNQAPGSMPPPGPVTPSQAAQDASGVTELLIDYNKKFAKAMPVKHRDQEVFQVVSQLMMAKKSCSLLVGAPGTGKTAIVEEIARLIAMKSPYTSMLNDYTLYELPLSSLMAGTSFRGQLEEKVRSVVEYCESNKVILFIDEIHQLCGGHGYDSVSQMLKPAMARGGIKMIGATTLQESKSLLEDPAFNRRFNKVQVCELSMDQTRDIIETVTMPALASHYGVGFANGLAMKVVQAAEKSKTITCHRPDNAITLLDQVCASTLLQRNANIMTCTDDALKQHMQSTPLVINAAHVENYNKGQGFAIPGSFDDVKDKIFFQDEVIDHLYETVSDYVRFDALFPTGKPFRIDIKGDPKSGRTTLVQQAAALIDEQPVYLDLADYSDAPSLNRIIGSPMGYVGSDSRQEMPFDIVESNPRKIIILDNMDKGHPVVRDFFESAMGTGLIKYADNRTVDIGKCIVFCVSEDAGTSRSIGFAARRDPVSQTKISIRALSASEMVDGAERMVRDMVASMKAEHSKYASIPDDLGIPDEDKNRIASPADMAPVARSVILSKI